MAFVIKWTLQANKGLDKVIAYLVEQWTVNEILQLENKINQLTKLISIDNELFPKSETQKTLHKAIVDKNNYLVYRVNKTKMIIEIVNFRGTKQKSKY